MARCTTTGFVPNGSNLPSRCSSCLNSLEIVRRGRRMVMARLFCACRQFPPDTVISQSPCGSTSRV